MCIYRTTKTRTAKHFFYRPDLILIYLGWRGGGSSLFNISINLYYTVCSQLSNTFNIIQLSYSRPFIDKYPTEIRHIWNYYKGIVMNQGLFQHRPFDPKIARSNPNFQRFLKCKLVEFQTYCRISVNYGSCGFHVLRLIGKANESTIPKIYIFHRQQENTVHQDQTTNNWNFNSILFLIFILLLICYVHHLWTWSEWFLII